MSTTLFGKAILRRPFGLGVLTNSSFSALLITSLLAVLGVSAKEFFAELYALTGQYDKALSMMGLSAFSSVLAVPLRNAAASSCMVNCMTFMPFRFTST